MRTSILVSALAVFSTCAAAYTSGQCGPSAGNQKCKDNKCCSKYGWCGTATDYCLPASGCQSAFGRCTSVSSTTTPSSAPVGKSTDKCGAKANGLICAPGYCCSQYGFCGKTSGYCSAGCQSRFGSCSSTGSKPSSSTLVSAIRSTSSKVPSPSAPATQKVSKDARCGSAFSGQTCKGSSFGNCCSKNNWCGSSKDYCSTGCQSAFGTCSGSSSSVRPVSSSSVRPVSSSSVRPVSSSSVRPVSSSSVRPVSSSSVPVSSTSQSIPSSSGSSTTSTPSPTPSAPVNRVLLPKVDASVDRSSPKALIPSNPLTLFYAEDSPGTYTMLINALLSSGANGILLENIYGASVMCSPRGVSIIVSFANTDSESVARTWPVGTILFTLAADCNAADERGVYILDKTVSGAAGNPVEFHVTKSTLKEVVDELDISYGQLVNADGKETTAYTTTVTSYFTNSLAGTLTSSTFVETVTPSLTTMTYTSTTVSSSTETFTLSPEASAALEEMSAGLPEAGEDGTINIPITKANDAILPIQPLESEPYNEDSAYQDALQAAFEVDQLDTPDTLINDATTALGDEESNVTPDGPVQLAVPTYAGTPDSVYDSAPPIEVISTSGTTNTPARAASAPAPRAVGTSDITTLQSRNSLEKRDGWDTFFAVMGDDLVGEVCEACGLISAGKDLYDAFKCLLGSCPSPPQKTIDTLEGITKQEFSMSSSLTKGGLAFNSDGKATILATDCYLNVKSLKVEGSVKIIAKQVNYPENYVMSAKFTATQSSVASILFNIRVNGPGSGTFDRALSTFKLDSLTVPSVFTISPKFMWGIGMSYDTAQAVDVQAGAVLTLSDAAADLDIKGKTANNARNWQPSAQVTYPTLTKAGRLILTPYIKTDIQLSLTIFGTYVENAAVLTTQTNLAFDAQVLTVGEVVTKRSTDMPILTPDVGAPMIGANETSTKEIRSIEKRSIWDTLKNFSAAGNLAALVEAARLAALKAGQVAKPECAAGSMKLTANMNTKNNAVIGGISVPLFDQNSNFGSQCIPFAAASASSTSSTSATPTPTPTSTRASSSSTSTRATSSSVAIAPICTNPASGFAPPAGSSCFKVIGHDQPSVEGKYLTKMQGYASPTFGTSADTPAIFYLDSNGWMYESYAGDVMATDRTDGGAWMQFAGKSWVGTQPKAVCTKDSKGTNSLSCFQTTTDVLTVSSNFGADDDRQVTPMFGFPDSSFLQISMTYENTACPAICTATSSSTPTPSSTIIPSTTAVSTPTSTAACVPNLSFYSPSGLGCFTVTGHGPAHIEGKSLGMRSGYSGSVFGWDNYTPATFYQDPDTKLVYIASEIANGWVMSMVADTGASPWMGFWPVADADRLSYPKATCELSTNNKDLNCKMAGFSSLIIAPTHDFYSDSDARSGNPIFGVPTGPWVSMTMTYTTASCPRKCDAAVSSTTPSATSVAASSTTVAPSSTTASSAAATPTPSDEAVPACAGYAPGGLTTVTNQNYYIYCGMTGSAPVSLLNTAGVASFQACMESCNALTTCKAVMYREIAPSNGLYQCSRYANLGVPQSGGIDWTGSYDVAIKV